MNAHGACTILGHESKRNAYGTFPKSVTISYAQVMDVTEHV